MELLACNVTLYSVLNKYWKLFVKLEISEIVLLLVLLFIKLILIWWEIGFLVFNEEANIAEKIAHRAQLFNFATINYTFASNSVAGAADVGVRRVINKYVTYTAHLRYLNISYIYNDSGSKLHFMLALISSSLMHRDCAINYNGKIQAFIYLSIFMYV